MSARRYAIIGTGALGGFYGAKLQKAGFEVHFLLRSDYEYVREQGLRVDSPQGNFTLHQVNAYQRPEEMPSCEVIILSLKTTQNYLLPQILPGLVKGNAVVLVLQNGLGVEAEIAEIIGSERILGGLCFLCSNKTEPGYIQHLDYGQITLGEFVAGYQPGGITERLRGIAQDFEQAGIAIELSDHLFLSRWKKLVWNIPYNGLSVVLNARTDELMQNEETRQLVKNIMEEVLTGAQGWGCHIPQEFIQIMLEYTDRMKPYRTSMKIDYDTGRLMEIETLFGNPLRYAKKQGVELPKIEMLYQQLKFLESRGRG